MNKVSSKTIRISVPITPEVLAKFQRFSDVSGLSLGKSIGDWLKDTVQGLDAMIDILEAHKQSPAKAMEKLTVYASALQEITSDTLVSMKTAPSPLREGAPLAGESLAVAKAAMRKAAAFKVIHPSGNTGGKGQENHSELPSPAKALITKTRKTRNLTPLPKGPVGPAKVQAYADNNGVPPGRKSRS